MKKAIVWGIVLLFCGNAFAETRARFLFIGDIMVHDQQLDAAKSGDTYDFSESFRRIKPLLKDSFVVGNLETVLAGSVDHSGKKLKYAGFPYFNTPDVFTENLSRDLGIDLLTLANNHIFDRGAFGARRTVRVLKSADIPCIGLGLDEIPSNDAVVLTNNGIRAAFINHSYGSNERPKSRDVHLNVIASPDIHASMTRAKALSPDVIIALFHWGNEYHFSPNVHQKRAAEWAFSEEASLIVGTHPHVLQPVEVRVSSGDVKAVAWSLGNFVSFQRTLPRERSMILAVEFVKDEEGRTRLAEVGAVPTYVVAPGSKRTIVTYAGSEESVIAGLDFEGLSVSQVRSLREIGRNVLEFLGAQKVSDDYGYSVLWREESADVLPVSRRKSPK
ncbi:MAG: CapA family protein [Synergistaceae bacterium]|nr:CapA family protein [Synergistaceae bacterium]